MYVVVFEASPSWNRKFIELAPSSVRTRYFDSVFSNLDTECRGCRFRLSTALDAIKDDLYESSDSYEYDYSKIIPFIRNDTYGGYEEPIHNTACLIIIRKNDRPLFLKMAGMYKKDSGVLRSCIYNGMYWVRDAEPTVFDLVYENLASIPALAPHLQRVPAPPGMSEREKVK
ncbi:MAG: hypothetical protein WC729_06205 [Sphingomonas sp.]|uniref:hypothetical protein n=1 Tax=Sphingomonas sp. TaxID=28214 RepID=UPI003563E6E1